VCFHVQGDVEAVASRSPKELTALIEQISGSDEKREEFDRLMIEKQKAEEDVRFNFKKRKGIGAEKKQYKEQKAEADKYNQLLEKQRQLQVEQMLFQLYHIFQDLTKLAAERTKKTEELEKVQQKQVTAEKALKERKQEQAKLQQEALQAQKQSRKKEQELEKERPASISAEQSSAHARKRLEANRRTLQQLEEDQAKHAEKIKALNNDLATLKQQEKDAETDFKKREQEFKVQLSDIQLAELRKIKEEAVAKSAADRQELSKLERTQQADRDSRERLQRKLDEFEGQYKQWEQERDKFVQRKERIQVVVTESTASLNEHKLELDESLRSSATAKARQQELQEQLITIYDQLRGAKSASKESERERKFKECLETLKRLFPGVHGRVIDIVQPSRKEYNTALTVVIGSHMDSIIVQDEKTAHECIQYMRDQRVGVATFLPLETIRGKSVDDRLRTLANGVVPIIDVLQYDKTFQRAIEYVCGTTLMCDDVDTARRLAFGRKERFKVVTKEGVLIHKSGLMTGGTSPSGLDAKAARWEEKQVDSLKKQRDRLVAEMTDVAGSLRGFAREQQLRSLINSLETRLRAATTDLDLTTKRLEMFNRDMEQNRATTAQTRHEVDKLNAAITAREHQIDALRGSVAQVEDKLYAAFEKKVGIKNIRDYEQRQVQLAKERTEKRLQLATQSSRITNLLEFEKSRPLVAEVSAIQDKVKAGEAELKQLEEKAKKEKLSVEKLQQEFDALSVVSLEKRALVEEKESEVREIKRNLDTRTKLVAALQKAVAGADAQTEQHRERRHALLRQSVLNEVPLPVKSGSLPSPADSQQESTSQAMRQQLSREDELELDWSELRESYKTAKTSVQRDEITNKLLEEIQSLGQQMDKLAPNLKAIDRLEDVSKRLEDTNQELETAKTSARELIAQFNEVREERQRLFIEAFEHVSSKIDTVYKELTGNAGMAYLTLDSLEDPFLHGVRYSAVPPSKTFRDIDQLSGGEKTVAALALLFALNSYKPAPFFIMDEVDAALDHSNVQTIANYFREKAKDVQMIIISLKDQCYEKADALVGIYIDTSQDCSRTLSLDLTQYA
jgi:structural maintenance of chromosome 1